MSYDKANYCVHAMDCNSRDCAKSHRMPFVMREKFIELNKIYRKNYKIELENSNGRFLKCSFGTICCNPECGYKHSGFSSSTRDDFRKCWNYFIGLNKSEQEDFLQEEREKFSPKVEKVEEVPKVVEVVKNKITHSSKQEFVDYLYDKYKNIIEDKDFERLEEMLGIASIGS